MEVMAETRKFRMHPQLLMDVIRRQAGTLAKALLEGAMNAVDAGATRFGINVTPEAIEMDDDGCGFKDKAEIEGFFEVFGQPHDEGDATYGRFRMGRGQIFSFGRNLWKSRGFTMDVDVAKDGLDYKLVEGDTGIDGCYIKVELYEELTRVSLQELKAELKTYVAYLQIPVLFNGEQLSAPTDTQKWDYEDEFMCIRFSGTGGLVVYNMGVMVKIYGGYEFGTGGTVVSKKQLKVNFARNDVMSDCPVWRKVKAVVKQKADIKVRSSPMTEHSRARLAKDFLEERGVFRLHQNKKLITDVRGRHHSLETFRRRLASEVVSSAPQGDRIGDRLMQIKVAFIISKETLDRFGVMSVDGLVLLLKCNGMVQYGPSNIRDFEDIRESVPDTYDILPEKELTPKEKLWLRIANRFSVLKRRRYFIGISGGAKMWTDGGTFIAVDRDWLKDLKIESIGDIVQFGQVLHHEYTHDDNNQESDVHGPQFYEDYHDTRERVGTFLDAVLFCLEKDYKTILNRGNKALDKALDRIDGAQEKLDKLDELERCLITVGKLPTTGVDFGDGKGSETKVTLVTGVTRAKAADLESDDTDWLAGVV